MSERDTDMAKKAPSLLDYDDPAEREDEESAPKPRQYEITAYGADYPIDSLVKRVRTGDIYVPTFQRHYVWKLPQASRFIESLLLGLPVPGIFLSREDNSNKMLVIDGQQRLETLRRFYDGKFGDDPFRLHNVQPQYEGRTYDELEQDDRRKLDDSILHATIVRQDSPVGDKSSIYHVFERLNTGGTPLTPQQIRTALFHGKPLTELLKELNRLKPWREIMGPVDPKGKDVELILRFLALYFDRDAYEQPMKDFLNDFMGKHANASKQTAASYTDLFTKTASSVKECLGTRAFRPERTFNAAVFDAVMVGLAARLKAKEKKPKCEDVAKAYNDLLKDAEFARAYKTSTSAAENVKARIQLATSAFAKL
jgi:hypothetical protein